MLSEQNSRALLGAGVHLPNAPVQVLCRSGKQIIASMRDGTQEVCDVVYPVLGCDIRSELGKSLGVRHNAAGCVEVDARQQTSLTGLYAIGDVVSDLHQIAVATGHAAVAPPTCTIICRATSADARFACGSHRFNWVMDAGHVL